MSHYTLEDLLMRWRREDLTAEQMIGQMLQVLHGHEQRLRVLERGEAREGQSATPQEGRAECPAVPAPLPV